MNKITPVVLCGGVGSRLWPMSRSQSPKQFHPIQGQGSNSFFQATVQRHRSDLYGEPVIVTAAAHASKVRGQLQGLQVEAKVISEPVARNTGPAVLAAALTLYEHNPTALLLVLPSDHVISGDFDTTIASATKAASDGHIVLFGITPQYAETGYGYIVDGGKYKNYDGLHSVSKFIEKPVQQVASSLVATKSAYWASGISLFSAETIINEYKRLEPATLRAVREALDNGREYEGDIYLAQGAFRRALNEPTERAIFERSSHVALAPADISWSDVGSWTSIYSISSTDSNGNALQGDVIAVDTENALVRSSNRLVAVVGVPEVIIVDTPDALLVTKRGKCQDVKKVVENLKTDERGEAKHHPQKEYFWGQSTNILNSGVCKMSMITINAGTSLEVKPIPGRRLISVKGDVDVFDGLQRRNLKPGEDIALDTNNAARLDNFSSDAAEVLLMSLSSSGDSDQDDRIMDYAV